MSHVEEKIILVGGGIGGLASVWSEAMKTATFATSTSVGERFSRVPSENAVQGSYATGDLFRIGYCETEPVP